MEGKQLSPTPRGEARESKGEIGENRGAWFKLAAKGGPEPFFYVVQENVSQRRLIVEERLEFLVSACWRLIKVTRMRGREGV